MMIKKQLSLNNLKIIVSNILNLKIEEIEDNSNLIKDLGFDSLDLKEF